MRQSRLSRDSAEEQAKKYLRWIVSALANVHDAFVGLLLSIVFLTISIVAELYGFVWVSLILTSLSLLMLVHQLDWPRRALGVEVKRWQLWFSIECVCSFFFFSVIGLSSRGIFFDPSPTRSIQELPIWFTVYSFLWILSPLFVFYRHGYLAPKRLAEYTEVDSTIDFKDTRERQITLEGGILALCTILGLGFSEYLEVALLVLSIFLAASRIKARRPAKANLMVEIADEYQEQSNQFWTRFAQAPRRLLGFFFLLSLVCFFNLPSVNLLSLQETTIILLTATALLLTAIAIRYSWSVRRTKPILTAMMVLLLVFTILNGDPAAFPSIRHFTRIPSFEAQSFWLFVQLLLVCMSIVFLNTGSQMYLPNPKTKFKQKLKNFARMSWFIVVTTGYAAMLIYSFSNIPIAQIRLLLVLGMDLLLTVPLFKNMRI